jgi:hypothetical protein
LLAAGNKTGLTIMLRAFPHKDVAARDRIDAAFLALAEGDEGLAGKLDDGLLGGNSASDADFAPGLYKTRWGVCELCSLALLERRRGDAATAARHESTAGKYLDDIEAAGHVWHGLHYLRATLQAAGGNATGALKSLTTAVDLGWRRAWLLRVDPAFEDLRADPRFQQLLARIDQANAASRAQLPAAASP